MDTRALSVKDAEAFLAKFDRHYKAPVEPICAIGVADNPEIFELARKLRDAASVESGFSQLLLQAAAVLDGAGSTPGLHGAAILGRRDDELGELAHIYVDGISQGYSLLYGACWRGLKALGYKRAIL